MRIDTYKHTDCYGKRWVVTPDQYTENKHKNIIKIYISD